MRNTILLLALAMGVSGPARADEGPAPVTVALHDGSTLIGRVVAEDDDQVTFLTTGGLELVLQRSTIRSMGSPSNTGTRLSDPDDSRLMLAATGRPLRRGDGYFSDHYVLFPGFSYGLTDNFSLSGGVTVVPGLGLSEQIFFVSPKLGWRVSDDLALSTGALYASGADSGSAASVFGVATFGKPDKSLTAGLGVIGTKGDGDEYYDGGRLAKRSWHFHDAPVVMLGGSVRLSNSVALVTESCLFLGDDFDLSQQPLGVALRFHGGRLSADVGMVLVAEVLDEGFPVPWLSFTYHLGPGKAPRERSRPPLLPRR